VVADPSPTVARPRPWPANLSVSERLRAALAEGAGQGLARRTLAVRLGIAPATVAALVTEHAEAVATPDGRLVAAAVVEETSARVSTLVGEHHRQFPLDPGIPLAALRATLGVAASIVDLALARLVSAGVVEVAGASARVSGWAPTLAGAESDVAAAVEGRLRSAGKEPPSVTELAAAIGADPRPVLRFLERRGTLVAIEEDRYYLASELAALVDALRSGMVTGRVYSPAELRDLTGLSRKYLIPFLEYCDRHGVTVRQDTGRKRAGT
jgi:selenocysteine-specific elongation factor